MEETELTELRKQCITSLYLCTDNICKYIDEEKEEEFKKLNQCVEDYCYLEAQQNVAFQALEKAKDDVDISNIDIIAKNFTSNLKSLADKKVNYKTHPCVKEFTNKVKQAAAKTHDDSELVITESQTQILDPITKRPLEDPVRNSLCGHVYEREAIMAMLQKRNNFNCPVVGCGSKEPIRDHHLISDEELKFRLYLTQHSTIAESDGRSFVNLDDSQ